LNLLAIKRGQVLGPVSAVERALWDGLGDRCWGVFDSGAGAGGFQDAVVVGALSPC